MTKDTTTQVGRPILIITILFVTLLHLTHGKAIDKISSCPLGFAPSKQPNGKFKCKKCAPGTYRADLVERGTERCDKCPYNTFTPFGGVADSSLCIACPLDHISKPGSARCKKCANGYLGCKGTCIRCKPGTNLHRECYCGRCHESRISTVFNAPSCKICPMGMRANEARTKCVRATCPPGMYWNPNIYFDPRCSTCEGRSIRSAGMEECKACAADETVAYDKPKTKCIKCKPGTYLSNTVSHSPGLYLCVPCPKGTTTFGFGKPMCRKKGGRCPKDTFQDADGDCNLCDRRHRFDAKKKKCINCGDLSVSSGGLSTKCRSCGPRSQIYAGSCECVDGYEMRKGLCSKCPAGSYRRNRFSGSKCSRCQFNEVSSDGGESCTKCPYGTYANRAGTACVRSPKCGKGLVIPGIWGTFSNQRTCVSPITGCPPSLKLVKKFISLFCVNPTGNIVCPKGQRFSKVGYGHGDHPRCINL